MKKTSLLLLSVIACFSIKAQSFAFDSTYLPHSVNDWWQYKMVIPGGRSYIFTVEVTGTENFEGRHALVFEMKSPSTHITSHQYYNFRPGIREYYGSSIPGENSFIKLNTPIVLPLVNEFPQAGVFEKTFHQGNQPDHTYDRCHYTYRFSNTDRFRFRTGSTPYTAVKLDYEEAVSDAGKDYNVMESKSTEWYVKGIGLVKSESKNADGTTGSVFTLVKAKINGRLFQ